MRLPSWLSRIMPRRAGSVRRFDAAQHNRLTASWQAAERSINTELRGDLDALRRRARDLAKNAPLARKFLGMCVSNIAGPKGFTLQARAMDGARPDALANNAIEAAWADWGKATNCDAGKRLSFAGLTRAIVRGVARDGEALVRIRQDARNKYGLALQFLDIERLDTTLCREPSDGKNAIIMGVEIDADGAPVAYWLANAPHGRDPTGKKLVRVPASEILHLFMTDDPEQVRGIPWMHAAMLTVNDLKGYNHAAIVAARIGASKMGFFTSPDGSPDPIADGQDAAGMPFTEVEPGQFGMAPPGYDFKSFDPDYPHANYAAFVKEHKRDIATGFGVAYNALANDLEGVNFSSIRSGTLEEREHWMLAQEWLIESFLDPIFDLWLDNALLTGAITMPNGSALPASKRAKFAAHQFQGRRWQWVDPLKDIEASIKAIENGLASPYTIAAQQGLDVEDVLDDIARFQAAAKAKNVELGKPAPAPVAAEPNDDSKEHEETKALRDMVRNLGNTVERMVGMMALHGAQRQAEAAEARAQAPAPVVNITNEIHEREQPAPVVQVTNEIHEREQAPVIHVAAPQVDVTVEAKMPDQPAPAVNVQVDAHMPNEIKAAIVSQPARITTSEVERDKSGAIKKTTQTEKDA